MSIDVLARVRFALRHRLGIPQQWVTRELLGKSFRVRQGTLRSDVDKDDAWLLACACHAERVVDVGANVGQAALLMLRSPTVREIVLIDANREALSVAAENLIHNRLSSLARFVCGFVSHADGDAVEFWAAGLATAGSRYRGHSETASRLGASFNVPTMTLDTLLESIEMTPDFVKVDTEGAEHEVLLGSTQLAHLGQTRFFVEMHSPPELPMIENAALVLSWCNAVGYAAWYLSDKTRLTTPEHIQHRGRCHLLLQPAAWEFPPWLLEIAQSAPLEAATDAHGSLR